MAAAKARRGQTAGGLRGCPARRRTTRRADCVGAAARACPTTWCPSALVFLAALPLTPNGKVDRKALPEPEAGIRARRERRATPLEEILVGVWGTVLKQPALGIHDNFFELGGHSLLATQLVSRLRDALSVTVPVRWLFESPTIAELADRLRPALAGEAAAEGAVEAAARQSRCSARSAAAALVRAATVVVPRSTRRAQPYLQHAGRRRSVGQPRLLSALRCALAEIVRRHEALRTCLVAEEGVPVQRILPAVPASEFPLPLIDLRQCADPDGEAKRLAGAEALLPFDLARDRGLRATLLRRGESDWTLLLTLHHIAADGWSIDILIRELVALYGACREGRPSPLPELAIQYADFAFWQRGYLQRRATATQLEFWRQRLAGAPERLQLPARPAPAGAAKLSRRDARLQSRPGAHRRAQGVEPPLEGRRCS